jgi:hypothetical protein
MDWRLTVRFESEAHAHGIFSSLRTHAAATVVAQRAKEGLVAERDAEWLRLYGATYDALRRGQAIVAGALETQSVRAEEQAEHRVASGAGWEPIESPPLPERDERLISEHEGKGPWGSEAEPDRVQAHFELSTTRDAKSFAEELASEGYDVHRAGSVLFIFADDGAEARRLGDELMVRAPAGAQLFFEGDGRMIWIDL